MQKYLLIFLIFFLSLSGMAMRFNDRVFELIEKVKKENGELINLPDMKIDDDLLKEIIARIVTQKKISRINLSFNKISEAGIADLIELLRQTPRIRELYLNDNEYIKKHCDSEQVNKLRLALLGNKNMPEILQNDEKISVLFSMEQVVTRDVISIILMKYLGTMMHEDIKSNWAKFVSIDGGNYTVASSPSQAKGQYEVVVSPFSITEHPITQEGYARVTGENPSLNKTKASCPLSYKIIKVGTEAIEVCADYPVENLTFSMIERFFAALESDPNYGYRLPKGIELEILGVHDRKVLLRDVEKFNKPRTHPVTYGQRNSLGIFPSSVDEWVEREYESNNGQSDSHLNYVAFGSRAGRIPGRYVINPKLKDSLLGFRVVRFPKSPKVGYGERINGHVENFKSGLRRCARQIAKNL